MLAILGCVCVCEDTYLWRLSAYRPPPAIAKPIRKFASAEEPEKSENAPNQFHMASFGVVAGGLFSFGDIWALQALRCVSESSEALSPFI